MTVTVNGIDPDIVEQIYSWIVVQGKRVFGREAAKLLIDRQAGSIEALLNAGILVKINSVIIPGINDSHIGKIAQVMAKRGADIHNCIPLIPTANTVFSGLHEPDPALIHRVRSEAGIWLQQMSHCARCRADACGKIGEKTGGEAHFERLRLLTNGPAEAVCA